MTILFLLLVAALVWKPLWATYRASVTRKGPEKVAEYKKRVADWREAIGKVFF